MDNTSNLDNQLNEALDMLDSGKDFIQIAIEGRKVKENIRWSRKKMIFGVLFVAVAIVKAYLFNDLGYLYTAYGSLVAIPLAIGLYLIWNGYSNLNKWKHYEPEIDDSKLKLTRRL